METVALPMFRCCANFTHGTIPGTARPGHDVLPERGAAIPARLSSIEKQKLSQSVELNIPPSKIPRKR